MGQVVGLEHPELRRRERELDAGSLPEDGDLDGRPPTVELREREDDERDGAARGDGARVEEDEVLTAMRRERPVRLVVDAEVERRGARAVAVRDDLGQPR